MKISTPLTTMFIVGSLSLGFTSAAGAQDPPKKDHPRREFICAHQDELKRQNELQKQLLESRLSLLNAKKSAVTSSPEKTAKVNQRIEKVHSKITKNDKRAAKLSTWATTCSTGTK